MSGTPLVRIAALRKYFAVKGGWLGGRRGQVHAVDDVSFDVAAGRNAGARR
jgi:ABC-type oligopeptide transport system ATPase subunit